jgi:ferredoxin-NADP reductase
MSFVIANIIQHGSTVKEFVLRRADGAALPSWSAGAHVKVDLSLPDGTLLERHYSLVGMPGESAEYRIAVLLDPNGKGGSRHMHEQFRMGDSIALSGPFNSFPASPATGRTVLIAGGIGITPMVSIAHALDGNGGGFELHYLARSQDRMVLLDELRRITSADLSLHVSESGKTRADIGAILGAYTPGATVYACGPAALLQDIKRIAGGLGWPGKALHFESFGARTGMDDRPVTVHLAQSDFTITVAPGTSILDALIDADMFVSYDCKRGECGSCHTPVLEGTTVHRDVCLTPAQRDAGMCTCVSWASSERIVLDL